MLTLLRLKNFQKHEALTLDFCPGVNVIIGATNSGKSAVIRAIRWLVEHRAISGLQTHGTENTRVGIVCDGNIVVRFKDKTGYGYQINDKPPYLATGSNQPVAVKQILGIEPINFQGQHDPPFLLSMTPGQMAKELNKIVDLGAIDAAMGYLSGILSKAKSNIEIYKDDIEKYMSDLAKVAWAEKAQATLEALDAEYTTLEAKRVLRGTINHTMLGAAKAYAQTVILDTQIQRLEGLVQVAQGMVATQETYRKLKTVVDGITGLRDFGPAIEALEPIVEVAQVLVAKQEARNVLFQRQAAVQAAKLRLDQTLPESFDDDLQSFKALLDRYQDRHWNRSNTSRVLESIENLSDSLDVLDFKIEQLQTQISEVPVCPTCKKPL